jgi:hypothetical protein
VSLLLPVPVEAAQSGSATLGDDHFAFKLQTASHSERATFDALLSAPLSAEVLQRRLPSHFACDACQEVIIDSSGTKTYRALPSQHWEELIDAWMCHDDQEINVSVTRGREGMEEGRRIADGDAWVADALIAWPGACASAGSLRMESRPTSSDVSTARLLSLARLSALDLKKVDVGLPTGARAFAATLWSGYKLDTTDSHSALRTAALLCSVYAGMQAGPVPVFSSHLMAGETWRLQAGAVLRGCRIG